MCCVPEKSEKNKDGAEEYADTSDESGNFSDIDDDEVGNCFAFLCCNKCFVKCLTLNMEHTVSLVIYLIVGHNILLLFRWIAIFTTRRKSVIRRSYGKK